MWLWFIVGFGFVFVAMAFFVTMYPMTPSATAVVRCRLWQYYIIEFRREIGPSRNVLGPATGSTSAAIQTAFWHLFFSVIGGVVLVAIGWGIRRISRAGQAVQV